MVIGMQQMFITINTSKTESGLRTILDVILMLSLATAYLKVPQIGFEKVII